MSADEEIMVIMSEAAETEGLELRPKNGGPNRRRRGPMAEGRGAGGEDRSYEAESDKPEVKAGRGH